MERFHSKSSPSKKRNAKKFLEFSQKSSEVSEGQTFVEHLLTILRGSKTPRLTLATPLD
jgi:hypothetical protein